MKKEKKDFKIIIPEDVQKQIDAMPEKDRAEFENILTEIKKNPYKGELIVGDWKKKLQSRVMYWVHEFRNNKVSTIMDFSVLLSQFALGIFLLSQGDTLNFIGGLGWLGLSVMFFNKK